MFSDILSVRRRNNYMSRRILDLSNLVELIENGILSVISVENKLKACSDITTTDSITPEKFIESRIAPISE